MSEKKVIKPVAFAVGAALAGTFAISGAVNAGPIDDSPFAMSSLTIGYMLGEAEGSCGGDKAAEGSGDAKDAEGSCGAKDAAKDAEGSCGAKDEAKDAEGSCGAKDEAKDEAKDAEGSCGEGSCGATKKDDAKN